MSPDFLRRVSPLRGRGTFQTIAKYPKDRRGQRRKHSRIFNGVFPGPLETGAVGGGWGFRWAAKSAQSTTTLRHGQKSRAFYGSYRHARRGHAKTEPEAFFVLRPPAPPRFANYVRMARSKTVFAPLAPLEGSCHPVRKMGPQTQPNGVVLFGRGGATK